MTKQELLFDITRHIENHIKCSDEITSKELSEHIYSICEFHVLSLLITELIERR